jgi:methionyl-tRNA synthetase
LTDGKVPAIDPTATTLLESDLAAAAALALASAASQWDAIAPHRALEDILTLCAAANVYVDRTAPWAEAKKGNTARVGAILATLLQVLEAVSITLWPVLPSKSDAMRRQLNLEPIAPRAGIDLWPPMLRTRPAGESLPPATPLFPTLDEPTGNALVDALTPKFEVPAAAPSVSPAPAAPAGTGALTDTSGASAETSKVAEPSAAPPAIAYDAFGAVDLRVGVVRACERVPKKDKLLRLSVDLGEPALRTIIAGLALSFSPEALVGRRVIVVANLAPRDFGKGLVSHGMLLATGPSERLTLATVDGEVPPGARLK